MFQWLKKPAREAPKLQQPFHAVHSKEHIEHVIRKLPPLPLRENAAPIDPTPVHKSNHEEHHQLNELRSHIEHAVRTGPAVRPFDMSMLRQRATNAFYAADGQMFWSLSDLADGLVHMNAETFSHHVTADRNDFANWTAGCINSQAANALQGKNRQELVKLFVQIRSTPVDAGQHFERPKPLPQSPLAQHEHSRVQSFLDELAETRRHIAHDVLEAREQFIRLRTRAWQELNDDERRKVLPALRETYEALLAHEH